MIGTVICRKSTPKDRSYQETDHHGRSHRDHHPHTAKAVGLLLFQIIKFEFGKVINLCLLHVSIKKKDCR
jgi:hypothetical protein